MFLGASSCTTGVKFDPDFYVGDYVTMSIVNEDGLQVYSDQPAFNDYACLHKDKVKELKEILDRARIPRATKRVIKKSFKNLENSVRAAGSVQLR